MRVEQWFAFVNVESCTLFLLCMISQILDLDYINNQVAAVNYEIQVALAAEMFFHAMMYFWEVMNYQKRKTVGWDLVLGIIYWLDLETWALHSKMAMSANLKEQSLSWKLCPFMAFLN